MKRLTKTSVGIFYPDVIGGLLYFLFANSLSDCDRSYTAESGTIANIGYPNFIRRRTECEYRIHVGRGYRIMLTMENITLPCGYAYIEIRYVPVVLNLGNS